MRSALARRPLVLPWALALAFVALIGFAGSRNVYWQGDFWVELYQPMFAAMHGDWGRFYALLPGYSGFAVIVGAPAAVITGGLGGMETMAYRLVAAPGLIAMAALGVAISGPATRRRQPLLAAVPRAGGRRRAAFETVRAGHAEDLLATAAAVGAVLAARSGRTGWASFMIVAAVVAKQSMVVAILLVAMAAPRNGVRVAAIGLIATAVLVLVQTQLGGAVHGTITNTGQLFHPHQIFWPFGVLRRPSSSPPGTARGWVRAGSRR